MEIIDFLIDEECTILEAMEQLDKVAKKVLFVVRNNQFVAAITDGDIRRWILRKGKLDAKVKQIANYSPKYLTIKEKGLAKDYMKKHSIEALPILNERNDIVTIIMWNDGEIEHKRLIGVPVVIMAGGLGTRLYPYTKILPKPLIPIGEIPIVEHIINKFHKQGSNQFFLVVNHKKNMIKAYLNEIPKSYDIVYADEETPMGTGGGLSLLKEQIDSTFILSNCDILVNDDYEHIYNFHKKEKNLITMICCLKNIKIPYGVIDVNETGEIEEMREKPELSFFTNTGIYIVEPKVIQELKVNEAIDFPDIIKKYKDKGERIGIYPISENNWLDMGQLDELENMRKRLEREE